MVDNIFSITDEINKDYLVLERYGSTKILIKRELTFIGEVQKKTIPALNEISYFVNKPILTSDQSLNINGEDYKLIPENNLSSSHPKAAKLLGQGSQGTVYIVEKTESPGSFFALKLFRQRAQGEFEARTLEFFDVIPAIIKPIAHQRIGFYHVILFPLYPECLLDTKKQSITNTFNILNILLQTLEDIHEKGYIHGDIKPDNILIDSYGMPCLADVGSSGLIGERGYNFGTPSFRYPYIKDNCKTVDADVWALGVTILYFLSRKRPFIDFGVRARFLKSQGKVFREKDFLQAVEEENIPNMVSWMLKLEIHNIDNINSHELDLLNIMEKIIIRMLEKDKENRPSIEELLSMMTIQKSK